MSTPDAHGRTVAVGLDLGSTYIKAGRLDARGRLIDVRALAAPALCGSGTIREGDVAAYVATARRLLDSVAAEVAPGTPLGISSQRSSFTVWERESGSPRLPLISWQDRRAADWCARKQGFAAEVTRRSGLPLSAHYAGPKLALLLENDPGLGRSLRDGSLLFGTLETCLLWNWTDRRRHETDLTMAARTTLVDLERADWSPELLDHYGIARRALPRIVPSGGRSVPLAPGLTLTATLADQASGALAVFEPRGDSILVNLGTGAFVLQPAELSDERLPGYLTGPILGSIEGHRYALEGAINGAGPALDRFGAGPTDLPERDPADRAFAVPDLAGLGAPYWQPERGLTLSAEAQALDDRGRRRVVLEGLLFRVREILDDLQGGRPRSRVLLAGGLTRDPAVGSGLAALLERPVERVEEQQCTLLGVARLAAGLPPFADPETTPIEPGPIGGYLPAKYRRWRAWFASVREIAHLRPDTPIGKNGVSG